jgi:hypothetical protein
MRTRAIVAVRGTFVNSITPNDAREYAADKMVEALE